MRKSPVRSTGNHRVAILGLGLMGGSLGLALRSLTRGPRVSGYARRPETRRLARKLGAVHEIFDTPEAAAEGADIVVICTPVLSTSAIAGACLPLLAPGAVVTDVGSTKLHLVLEMKSLGVPFVGSHPITGSEQTGLDAARADLYRKAAVILTPGTDSPGNRVRRIARFWHSVGARTIVMSPERHDAIIAATSHLPHLVAATLVNHVANHGNEGIRDLCGGGFRDTTRIADGSPDMWHDIVATNSTSVLRELKAFRTRLDSLASMIGRKDLAGVRRYLEQCRRQRRRLVD